MRRVSIALADRSGSLHERIYTVDAPCPLSAGVEAIMAAQADATRTGCAVAYPTSCDGVEYDCEIDWVRLEQDGVE